VVGEWRQSDRSGMRAPCSKLRLADSGVRPKTEETVLTSKLIDGASYELSPGSVRRGSSESGEVLPPCLLAFGSSNDPVVSEGIIWALTRPSHEGLMPCVECGRATRYSEARCQARAPGFHKQGMAKSPSCSIDRESTTQRPTSTQRPTPNAQEETSEGVCAPFLLPLMGATPVAMACVTFCKAMAGAFGLIVRQTDSSSCCC
jgi:hypothetical protein